MEQKPRATTSPHAGVRVMPPSPLLSALKPPHDRSWQVLSSARPLYQYTSVAFATIRGQPSADNLAAPFQEGSLLAGSDVHKLLSLSVHPAQTKVYAPAPFMTEKDWKQLTSPSEESG